MKTIIPGKFQNSANMKSSKVTIFFSFSLCISKTELGKFEIISSISRQKCEKRAQTLCKTIEMKPTLQEVGNEEQMT